MTTAAPRPNVAATAVHATTETTNIRPKTGTSASAPPIWNGTPSTIGVTGVRKTIRSPNTGWPSGSER